MRFLSCYLKLKMRNQRNEIKVLLLKIFVFSIFLMSPSMQNYIPLY